MYQAEYCPICDKKTLRETYPCDCQKTAHNREYMMALNEILHNRLDCLENGDKLIGLINGDIQRLNQRS